VNSSTAWTEFGQAFTTQHVYNFVVAILIFVVGSFIARRLRAVVSTLSQLDTQQRLLLTKVSYYGLLLATIAASLGQLGVDVRVLVGAAGVLTVAVGFAAQTSASNLISGLFLMVERPFVVGDIISIGDTRGEVMSIDLLSSKIRTFNNLMVRIPNETLVKSNIINYSYFPVRRLDFNLNIGHDSDLGVVESTLRQVASAHPLCLEDPQAIFLFNGFAESAMTIQFQVWTLTENMIKLQNELYRDIKRAFDLNGIRIPYPTRTLITVPAQAAPQQASAPL
jgi:small-conductance mechanosensitive channel